MDFTALHLFSLILTAPAIIFADHMGFLYFTGKVQTLNLKKVQWTHRIVTIGLILLIVTGVIITVPMWEVMFIKPLFYTKLALVATLVVNGIFIGELMKKATLLPFKDLSQDEKRFLMVSGAVSACGWVGSVLIGFLGL